MHKHLSQNSFAALLLALLMIWPGPSKAEETNVDQAFDFFLQESEVTTASRRAQRKSEAPVAIDVITREEIQSSSALNIWDLLRFRIGVDVVEASSADGNRALVSVRGLPEEFVSSLQVLVDGRSIVTQHNSGVFWHRIPVGLNDIERIEIVRGPNSALFGSNAGFGVINIITRKPEKGAHVSGGFEAGELGQNRTYASVSGGSDKHRLRFSVEDTSIGSYPNQKGDIPAAGNQRTFSNRISLRTSSNFWEGGELEFLAGIAQERGSIPPVFGNGQLDTIDDYQMLKISHQFSDSLDSETWISRAQSESGQDHSMQIDAETLLRSSLWEEKLQTVIGLSYRDNTTESQNLFNYDMGGDESIKKTKIIRAYVSDTLRLMDWVSLSTAASIENSDTGETQGAYQGALVFTPVEDHALRVSASRAPTLPSLMQEYGKIDLIAGFDPPDVSTFSPAVLYKYDVQGDPNLNPVYVSSYEATLSGSYWDRRITAEVTAFQMEVDGLTEFSQLGTTIVPGTFPFVPSVSTTVLQWDNAYFVRLRGLETGLTLRPREGMRLHINYTYEDVKTSKPTQRYDEMTPLHKLNFIGSMALPFGFKLSGNLGLKSKHEIYLTSRGTTEQIKEQAKVDLRLGWRPNKIIEFYAAGLNLGAETRIEASDGLVIPQMYLIGANIAFGGTQK